MKLIVGPFVIFLLVIVLLANFGLMPQLFSVVYDFPGGGKLGYFLLIGIFSFVVNLFSRASKLKLYGTTLHKGFLIIIYVVVIEEFSQIFIETRSFLIALFFNVLGQTSGFFVSCARICWRETFLVPACSS